jgi:hypothetical protein
MKAVFSNTLQRVFIKLLFPYFINRQHFRPVQTLGIDTTGSYLFWRFFVLVCIDTTGIYLFWRFFVLGTNSLQYYKEPYRVKRSVEVFREVCCDNKEAGSC